MSLSFENKVALVTGAASGIGLATATAFAKAGASVALADWNEDAVKSEAEKLASQGYKTIAIKCDVSKEKQVKEMVEKTVSNFGKLDAAYNNAAIQSPVTDTADLESEEWDRVMNINLKGVWLCMKYELQQMRKQGNGCIVNCSSLGGLVGLPGRSAYHAAKHAVIGLTKCSALEYTQKGIRINAICPGTINTPMVSKMFETGNLDKEEIINAQPIGRLGESEEIANAVLWLCSPGSSFVLGQSIAVDGGYTII